MVIVLGAEASSFSVQGLIEIAFTPRHFLRKLVLVSLLQLAAHVGARLARFRWHLLGLSRPSTVLRHAKTYADWLTAQREFALRSPEQPMPEELYEYCAQLDERADGYLRLVEKEDMHGLMFELRSELIRSQAGGSGYNRDGNVTFRKHRGALELISRSQGKVCEGPHVQPPGRPPPPRLDEPWKCARRTERQHGSVRGAPSGSSLWRLGVPVHPAAR